LLSIIETLTRGGAERVLVNTLPELQKLGIKCEVAILFKRDDLAKELESKGIKVHRLNLSYKWNIIEGVYKLSKLIKKNHYDIVHAHLFFAYFYTGLIKAIKPKIKTITTFHNLGFDEYPANTFLKKVRKKMEIIIINKFFDKTTAVSYAVKKHYQKHLNQKNIDIIHNSFPILEFKKYKNKKIDKDDFLNTDNHFTILTPGRFVEKKGHIYLIEAINILNQKYTDLYFIFVGRGPLKASLEKKVPSNVKILSEIEHKKLMQMYNKVDLIVIPSIYEAFGLVVGEAMIMEKPIVATNVDGIVDMITDKKEGLLVPPKDSNTLADAIERLYKDKDLREILAKNAKEKIKQFDTKIIAKQWKKYYEKLLEEKNI
jgi:glycosyltransferase involved in cell wall biosynthesis